MWVFAILIVLVLGGVAAVAAGFGSPMPEAHPDRPDVLVPADEPLGAADLRRVRFSVALRGYRMSEVDALLARLAQEAAEREADSPATGTATDATDTKDTKDTTGTAKGTIPAVEATPAGEAAPDAGHEGP